MAHALHSASQLLARHQESMMASLAYRLEVAKAANNVQLVELLEQERRQIVASTPQSMTRIPGVDSLVEGLLARLSSLSQTLADRFAPAKQPVGEFTNGSDRWWYTFDPHTGEAVYADSEAELRQWIQNNG